MSYRKIQQSLIKLTLIRYIGLWTKAKWVLAHQLDERVTPLLDIPHRTFPIQAIAYLGHYPLVLINATYELCVHHIYLHAIVS